MFLRRVQHQIERRLDNYALGQLKQKYTFSSSGLLKAKQAKRPVSGCNFFELISWIPIKFHIAKYTNLVGTW